MFDDAVNLTLSVRSASALAERAKAVGIAPEALAAIVLEQELAESGRWSWTEDDPLVTTSAIPADQEPVFELNDALAEFDAELEKRLANRT